MRVGVSLVLVSICFAASSTTTTASKPVNTSSSSTTTAASTPAAVFKPWPAPTPCTEPASCAVGIAWLLFFTAPSILCTYLFWVRRDIQPIKARSPLIVVVNDIVLIIFVVTICFQRIYAKTYPCLLNLWSGWIGLLMIFSAYLWRGWLLYFTYNLALARLNQTRLETQSYFLRNRHFMSGPFLTRFFGTLCVFFTIPCAILTASPEFGLNIIHGYGDEVETCNTGWGPYGQGAISMFYLVAFTVLALNVKSVGDNFLIKSELKWTGGCAAIGIIFWFVFNLEYFEQTVNIHFPVSSFALLTCATVVFYLSTVRPLRMSYTEEKKNKEASSNTLGNLDYKNLGALLKNEDGQKSFEQFLVKEFSVENILFWREVVDFEKNYNFLPKRVTHSKFGASMTDTELCSMSAGAIRVGLEVVSLADMKLTLLKSLTLTDRTHHLQHYKCFDGGDLVNVLLSHFGALVGSREEAVDLGNQMIKLDFICSLTRKLEFKDSRDHYHFKEKEKKLSLMSRLTQQQDSVSLADVAVKVMNGELFGKALAEARGIHGEYIEDDSPNQINLPMETVHELEELLREAPKWDAERMKNIGTIFANCQKEIYNLMKRDSFPRYIRSQVYKDFIKDIEAKKHKKKVLSEMNLG